jgi:hypothetical protein
MIQREDGSYKLLNPASEACIMSNTELSHDYFARFGATIQEWFRLLELAKVECTSQEYFLVHQIKELL